jgi:hypothetical protein
MTMADELLKPRRQVRGRPFEKGRSGNPAGRRRGSRNRATLAAAVLLEGESEALTRKAVELALAGDPVALRLCIERILPVCRERAVRLALPAIEGASDVSAAANVVTSALARGALTPSEAERIALVVETFARAIDTTKRREFAANSLQILSFDDFHESDDCDSDESDDGDYEDAEEYDP